jgi:hypothetical protein
MSDKSICNIIPASQVLFKTNNGYRGGYILSLLENKYKVLFTRDEFGNSIHTFDYISTSSYISPVRMNKKEVYIFSNSDAKDYIKAGNNINDNLGLGSGIHSSSGKDNKYPIYNPLTFHDINHRNTLIFASSFITQLIEGYFQDGKFSEQILDQAHWLVNVVLIIDDFEFIPKDVFLEAINNFCLDYIILSPGTLIRQPINYVFDILQIDGVYCKNDISVSYISPDNK